MPQTINNGAEGIRTPDLFSAIEALSQLSYSPTLSKYKQKKVLCQMP
jgi:hypothetical protein